jgi:hypothetical protein
MGNAQLVLLIFFPDAPFSAHLLHDGFGLYWLFVIALLLGGDWIGDLLRS